jgi:hypothetical protein
MLADDLLYCGIHRCLVLNCRNPHMATNLYCGEHWDLAQQVQEAI